MLSSRSLVVLVGVVLTVGCARIHGQSDPPADGGSSFVPDAGERPLGDAGPRPDAARPDAGVCSEGALRRLDPAPLPFDGGRGNLSLAHDEDRFYLGHHHGNPSPCDGPCVGLIEIERTGPLGSFQPAYWSALVGESAFGYVTGPGGALGVSFAEVATAWQRRPLRREGWQADGTYEAASGEVVRSVVPTAEGTLHVLLHDAVRGERGYLGARVIELSLEGEPLGVAAEDPILGFEVLDARLVPSSTSGSWLATVQDWDFPPTVQLNHVGSPSHDTFFGSSCGVDDFDMRELGAGYPIVAQRCGRTIELHERVAGSPSSPFVVTTDASPIAPALTVVERTVSVAIAYVEAGADAPTVEHWRMVEPGLWVRDSALRLPADPRLTLPIAELAIETLPDRTIGVAWQGTVIGDDFGWSQGAFMRLDTCER